ncbi:MAG: (2Fe-2S)-binding protein [Bacteriovoracaceae bacterium]|jgi:NAD(P)H-nitrite reductase large subunit|nr:(2Fe-2S)-binding protein [Bacteriovoracaceae bacterium]
MSEIDSKELEYLRSLIKEKSNKSNNNQKQLICECCVVSKQDLYDYYKRNGNLNLAQVKSQMGLGSGCGSCIPRFYKIKKELTDL